MVGGRSQAIAMQGTAHLNQAMARPDHKDQGKSPDLVTVHPKGQTITACHHKDQVIMVAPPLKDHKNPLLEVVDQAPGLVALSQVDQHQSQGNSLVLPACSRCSQPPTLPQQHHRSVGNILLRIWSIFYSNVRIFTQNWSELKEKMVH